MKATLRRETKVGGPNWASTGRARMKMTNRAARGPSLDPRPSGAQSDETIKDLYEIGEIPPLGHVPARMYAWSTCPV